MGRYVGKPRSGSGAARERVRTDDSADTPDAADRSTRAAYTCYRVPPPGRHGPPCETQR